MKHLASCLLALIPACASNDAVHISDEEYDDAALSIGSTTAAHGGGGEIGAMADVMLLASGTMPLGFLGGTDGLYHGEHLGLRYDYELACVDAGGHRLASCGHTTDRARVHVTWKGRLELPFLMIAVEREGDWTIRDLTTDAPILDGDGHMTYDTAVDYPERGARTTYHFAYDARYEQVHYAEGRIAGTTRDTVVAERTRTTGNRTDTRSFELGAVITFAANGHAVIDLDGTRRYDLDVTSGAVVRLSAGD